MERPPDARQSRGQVASETTTGLSVEELADAADVSVRTVRYYIAEGLLPGPGSRGKLASYGDEHLARLRLIRRLAEQRVPLAEMRTLLAPLALDEVRALLAEEERHAAHLDLAAQAPSPQAYVSGLLNRAQAARQSSAPGVSGARPSYRPKPSSPSPRSPGLSGAAPYQPYPSQQPVPAAPPASEPSQTAQAPHPAEAWQRWELTPGVELHVRAEAERRHRGLIRRLLAATRDSLEHPEGR